jgi:hypothetical protein
MIIQMQNVPTIERKRNHAQIVKQHVKEVIVFAKMVSVQMQMANVSKCHLWATDVTQTRTTFYTVPA